MVEYLKYRAAVRNFRKIANKIYGKFPFFSLGSREFFDRCLALQRCGAGIVLGRAKSGFEARVIEIRGSEANSMEHSYENLSLGHFGEIVFRPINCQKFTHTGMCGFFDQRGRIWCCGPIARTLHLRGERYFPFCIEPLFERLWWVSRAKLVAVGAEAVTIAVNPKILLFPVVKIFEKFFLRKLETFSKKFRITSTLGGFLIAKLSDESF
ncbi:MAG: hypothetical protein LBB18_03505 [Puniceicoccales bacterium]|jgi:acyl-CoA synthetase (AMP-forming)/AMP-acid ligase II|nr:hypothetical protein [Puniceicoccales bacterium]